MPRRMKAPMRKSTKAPPTEERGKNSRGKYIFFIRGALPSKLGIARVRELEKKVQGSRAL